MIEEDKFLITCRKNAKKEIKNILIEKKKINLELLNQIKKITENTTFKSKISYY